MEITISRAAALQRSRRCLTVAPGAKLNSSAMNFLNPQYTLLKSASR